MKIGLGAEDINDLSFRVQKGWSGPDNAEAEKKIIHEFIDKSIEVLDYGARVKQVSNFSFIDIPKANYLDLIEYLETKIGLPLKITEENTGENVFTETNELTEYYVYLKSYSKTGEMDFSTNRQRFEVSLNVIYIGEESTSKQNEEDSSLIDVLIEIDTIRAYLSEPETPIEGDRWVNVESSNVQIYNNGSWVFLQNLPDNNSEYNYYFGKFYWSLFSDIPFKSTTPDEMTGDFKAGLILKDSLSMPSRSIRISDGPNIAYKNGFSFKLRNNNRFWKFISDNGIALFGAKVTLYVYNKSSGNYYVQKLATGINNTNSFGYSDYQFNCEPITLNSDPKFNNSLISETNERYTGINPKNSKKVPYRTFGRWELAKLQDVSIEESVLNVSVKRVGDTSFRESFKFTAYTDRTILTNSKYKTLYIYKTGTGKELCEFTADQISEINDSGQFIVSILYDTNVGTKNKDKIIKIESISDETTFYEVTLKDGLEPGDNNSGSRPSTDDNLACVIHRNGYQYQIDENPCGGFKVHNGVIFTDGLKIYGLNEKGTEIEEIPYTGLEANVDNNKLILSPEITSNKTKADVYEDVTKTRIYNKFDKWPKGGNYFFDGLGTYQVTGNGFTKTGFYTTVKDYKGYSQGVRFKCTSESDSIKLFSFLLDHTTNNSDFLTSKNVRLSLKLDILSWVSPATSHTTTNGVNVLERDLPAGFKINLRAKKYDGTYIYGDSIGVNWEHVISSEKLGIYKNKSEAYESKGRLIIDNTPETGNFKDVTDLNKNWSAYCIEKATNRAGRNFGDSQLRTGDYVYIEDVSEIDKVQVTGTSVTYTNDALGISIDEIVLKRDNIKTTISGVEPIRGPVNVKKVISGSPHTLHDALEDFDFKTAPVFGGKDLFDLTPLFGASYVWDTIEALELYFINEDFNSYQYELKYDATKEKNPFYYWNFLYTGESLKILAVTEKELIERPLYTACDGESIKSDGTIGTPVGTGIAPIFKNVLEECYGTNVNQTSIDSLASIRLMEWRKQFYGTVGATEALKDLLESSWAVAYFDKDDKINIKSLNEKDYPTPIVSITDSDILWISDVKMRSSDEIFQRFNVRYSFYPPSMDSSIINKFSGEVYTDKNSNDIDNESKLNLQRSSNLFLNENTLERELEYIYKESDAKFISKQMVNWHVYNSWELTLEISISEILSGSTLEIMDYIKFNSYFYTNNQDVYGFITEIHPDIYNGKIKITIYIPRPKGQLGPYTDPFNDALFLGSRDISSWTTINGKLNDSGQLSTRGSMTEKDASMLSTRNLND